MTFCPGKKQRGGMTGDWDRDLELDLEVILASGSSTLVNLMEDHEMRDLGVADTAERIPEGLQYLRWPIADAGTPGPTWEAHWRKEGAGLISRLRGGENIVLHCKGGLGRTGMIAACLLVQFECTAEDAISAVRAARPGTIETAAQERFISVFALR